MNRREFATSIAGAAASATLSPRSYGRSLTEVARKPPFKFSVMLWTLGKELPFERRLEIGPVVVAVAAATGVQDAP